MSESIALPDVRDPGVKKIVFKMQAATLNDNGAAPWLSVIPMGTPGQNMKFAFDTGTTHSWATSSRFTRRGLQTPLHRWGQRSPKRTPS